MTDTRIKEGETWVFQADITNDACCTGTHIYDVVPGQGNELEVLYGSIFNGDTVARSASLRIFSEAAATNLLIDWYDPSSLNAAARFQFPQLGEIGAATINQPHMRRVIISGLMLLRIQLAAVAVSQDSAIGLVARIPGGTLPVVSMSGGGGATIVTNINRTQ